MNKTTKKTPNRQRFIRLVNGLLMGTLAVLIVSGILLHPLHDVLAVKILHELSAVLFILGVILHIVQHAKLVH